MPAGILDFRDFSEVDQPDSVLTAHRPRAGGWRGGCGGDGLLHAQKLARRLRAGAAGAVFARDSRGTTGRGLPLLPQHGGKILVLKHSGGLDVHELSQPGFEG